MQNQLSILKATRENMLQLLKPYSLEELNHIPDGFNNNLIWNLGHIIATQQLLIYSLSGLAPKIDADLIARYRKGTRPEGNLAQGGYELFQDLCFSMIDATAKDYEEGKFQEYKPYTTSYGVTLSNIDEAIAFNNVHEGMHLGTMKTMRKLI